MKIEIPAAPQSTNVERACSICRQQCLEMDSVLLVHAEDYQMMETTERVDFCIHIIHKKCMGSLKKCPICRFCVNETVSLDDK